MCFRIIFQFLLKMRQTKIQQDPLMNDQTFCENCDLINNHYTDNFKVKRYSCSFRLNSKEKKLIKHLILFLIGLIISLECCDVYISEIKAFIEFRTRILNKVNFSGFDNEVGSEKYLIPNYIHYIRLDQPYIRWELINFRNKNRHIHC